MMRKLCILFAFLTLFGAPTLVGCGGSVSQDSARDQVERDKAEEAAAGEVDTDDAPGDDE